MVEIFGALSNPEVQENLERLVKKLDQIGAGGAAPRPTVLARSRRVGAVPDAIVRVLSESAAPLRMRDIHAEVEIALGQAVSRSTVKNWLASHICGEKPRLVRLGRGRYRLAT